MRSSTSRFLDSFPASRIYPITDRSLSGRSQAEQVEELANRNFPLVQLREKNLPAIQFYRDAEESITNAHRRGMKIILNDRVDLAMALHADGVHLGQDDLPVEAARRLLGEDSIIGFSTHNLLQARAAANLPIDYLAVGPIFPTSTKQSANPPVGLEGLRAIRHAVPGLAIVAIGGITSMNMEAVRNAGADAVAIIRDLWLVNR